MSPIRKSTARARFARRAVGPQGYPLLTRLARAALGLAVDDGLQVGLPVKARAIDSFVAW